MTSLPVLRSRLAALRARRAGTKGDWQLAIAQAVEASRLAPASDPRVLSLLDRAERDKRWSEASTLLESLPARIVGEAESVALRRSFHEEQRTKSLVRHPKSAQGLGTKIVVFNDTDGRPNIGCRLTSVGLKSALSQAFINCLIDSRPFQFRTLRRNRQYPTLEERLLAAYGASASTSVASADIVVFQPEGTIDPDIGAHALRNFLSPIAYATQSGKPVAILNGTIPTFDDRRREIVDEMLSLATVTAGRDTLTASNYGLTFLPDAALLHPSVRSGSVRDGLLVTTGARNDAKRDEQILEQALAVADAFGLRPMALTKNSARWISWRSEIERRGGIISETASLRQAFDVVGRCRLHVGARYHMAILAYLCGTPSLLFDVATGKNGWLHDLTDTIQRLEYGGEDTQVATRMVDRVGRGFNGQESLSQSYRAFLRPIASRIANARP